MERPHRLLPAGTSISLIGCIKWNPDIDVIMLGPNDSKAFNWFHAEAFVPYLTEFVQSCQEIDSQPRVLFATPTPFFGDDLAPFDSKVMSQQIAPAIREVSKQLDLKVVEFHDRMLALKVFSQMAFTQTPVAPVSWLPFCLMPLVQSLPRIYRHP